MRISDWSSDVCSSDLAILGKVKLVAADGVVLTTPTGDVKLPRTAFVIGLAGLGTSFTAEQFPAVLQKDNTAAAAADAGHAAALIAGTDAPRLPDRKSDDEGKSVSKQVKMGGARLITTT